MFRCTTELKGLIIDADSFEEEIDWHIFDVHYKFFFITSDEQISGRLSNQYGADTVWCVKKYLKLFAPNHVMHGEVDLCQYFEHKKLKGYADFFNSSSSFCCGVI